jgi:hypothetical protein
LTCNGRRAKVAQLGKKTRVHTVLWASEHDDGKERKMSEQERNEAEVEGQSGRRVYGNEEPAITPEEKAEEKREDEQPEVEGQSGRLRGRPA